MTICSLHRDELGTRWKTGKMNCCIPSAISTHPGSARKGDRGISLQYAMKVVILTGICIAIGSRKFIVKYC